MNIDKLVTRKEVLDVIKVHYHTLMSMVERGEIDTIKLGNKKLYNLDKYLRINGVKSLDNRKKVCYTRVSSKKQVEDLKRQQDLMKKLYPNHDQISDIGSGLNNKRKGYLLILDMGIRGEISELVVSYKDRLSRFGYDQMEYIINKYSKGKIIVLNENIEKTPTEEVTEDLVAIMNVYVAKVNGLRKHKNEIRRELKGSNSIKKS